MNEWLAFVGQGLFYGLGITVVICAIFFVAVLFFIGVSALLERIG